MVLIIDVSPFHPAKNGESYLSVIKKLILSIVDSLEIDDRIILYRESGFITFHKTGEFVSSLVNYTPHDFRISKVMNQSFEFVSKVVEEDDDEGLICVFAITDKYDDKMEFEFNRATKREEFNPFLIGVGSLASPIANFSNSYHFDDPTDINSSFFSDVLFELEGEMA